MIDRPDFNWTEDNIATLKRLWSDGATAAEIAARLPGDVSRNAVIGKVHRLKLPKRGNTGLHSRTKSAAAKPSAPQPLPPMPIPDEETDVGIDVTSRIGLIDLTNHTCRWPVGSETGAGQMFCGCHADMLATGPYCREHTVKAEFRR